MIAAISSRIASHRAHLPALRLWAGRGFWAVTDQALFAGTNFLVNILLARWLDPAEYGAFAVAYSIFLLLGTLHTGLWTEPMLVYGSGRFRESFTAYQCILLRYHWRFGALVFLLFVLLAATFGLLGQPPLARSFAGLAVAAPLVLYLWLVRRGAYVLLEPRLAAYAGLAYLAIFLGLVASLYLIGWLDTTTALVCMGVSAWLAGRWAAMRVRTRAHDGGVGLSKEEVLTQHWTYGRWAVFASGMSWLHANVYFIVLPMFHGLEVVASLRAMINLVTPIMHVYYAISTLSIPYFVKQREGYSMLSVALSISAIQIVPAVAFMVLSIIYGDPIIYWIYGGKYTSTAFVWLAAYTLPMGPAITAAAALRAIEQPLSVATGFAVGAVFNSTIGVWMVYSWSAIGGAIGLLSSAVASAMALVVLVARTRTRQSGASPRLARHHASDYPRHGTLK